MNETLMLIIVWLAGLMLGTIFFGGLWWTVRNGVSAKQPALWFIGSLLLRTIIVLAGLYFVSKHDLLRLLVCLPGFLSGRFIVLRLTQAVAKSTCQTQNASHAP